jgi:hypothetical protein
MRKKFQIKLNPGKACTGSAQSFKFLHKIMYKRVHQSAAGSSPLASERKKKISKNIIPDIAGTGSAQGPPWASK